MDLNYQPMELKTEANSCRDKARYNLTAPILMSEDSEYPSNLLFN